LKLKILELTNWAEDIKENVMCLGNTSPLYFLYLFIWTMPHLEQYTELEQYYIVPTRIINFVEDTVIKKNRG